MHKFVTRILVDLKSREHKARPLSNTSSPAANEEQRYGKQINESTDQPGGRVNHDVWSEQPGRTPVHTLRTE